MAACQNLSIEIDSIDCVRAFLFFEVLHDLRRLLDILHHGLDLVDCVMATLNLQLLNHLLLCFVGDTGLIQQPVGQKVGVRYDVCVSAVKTAEEAHYSVKSLVDLNVTKLLKTLLELVISVKCDVLRSLVALVHELLEALVSGLLESDVVVESYLNQLVHL